MNTRNPIGRAGRVPGGSIRPHPLSDRVREYAPAPLSRFDEAVASVRQDDHLKWDTTVLKQDLVMKDGALVTRSSNEDETRLYPTRWALGQMCARLGIPAAYFAACPPILRDVQANYST